MESGFPVRAVVTGNPTRASTISSPALQIYADNGTIHVVNAQPSTMILVFNLNGKTVASDTTDADGSAEIRLLTSKGTYVVSDSNQSTKIALKRKQLIVILKSHWIMSDCFSFVSMLTGILKISENPWLIPTKVLDFIAVQLDEPIRAWNFRFIILYKILINTILQIRI